MARSNDYVSPNYSDADLLMACEAGHEAGCANQLDSHLAPERALLKGLEEVVTGSFEFTLGHGGAEEDPDMWDAAAIGYLVAQASPAARRALVSLIARELGVRS